MPRPGQASRAAALASYTPVYSLQLSQADQNRILKVATNNPLPHLTGESGQVEWTKFESAFKGALIVYTSLGLDARSIIAWEAPDEMPLSEVADQLLYSWLYARAAEAGCEEAVERHDGYSGVIGFHTLRHMYVKADSITLLNVLDQLNNHGIVTGEDRGQMINNYTMKYSALKRQLLSLKPTVEQLLTAQLLSNLRAQTVAPQTVLLFSRAVQLQEGQDMEILRAAQVEFTSNPDLQLTDQGAHRPATALPANRGASNGGGSVGLPGPVPGPRPRPQQRARWRRRSPRPRRRRRTHGTRRDPGQHRVQPVQQQ